MGLMRISLRLMTAIATKSLGSEAVTEGLRIRVEPSFLKDHSDAQRGRFIFAYKVRIANEGTQRAKLRSRAWRIVDADGTESNVNGPGVVGQYPVLDAGGVFEYSSFCPLSTSWGTMEGHFVFERDDKSTFEADVARFYFASHSE